VRAAVNTSEANVEEACAIAWAILLRGQPDREGNVFGWLHTTATREAVRLDRADRRHLAWADGDDANDGYGRAPSPAGGGEPGASSPPARPCGPSPSCRRGSGASSACSPVGTPYDEIGAVTSDSWRTVDRQLRRAAPMCGPSKPPNPDPDCT
jgi:hypothetical protein